VRRTAWRWARLVGGLAILLAIGWRVGTGPFLDGARSVGTWSIAGAVFITAATTVCSAWRWQVVARGLGVRMSLRGAIAAYYRSQFLNTVLPGGVLGDVHRGVDHGRATGDLGRGLRAVAWERVAGQAIQLAVALVVIALLPSPARSALPIVLTVAVVLIILSLAAIQFAPRDSRSRWQRVLRTVASDVRHGLLTREAWPSITVSSLLVCAGHIGVFLIAAHAAAVTAGFGVLLPLAVLVLVAAAVPTNIGGWGPREGVAAWLFASAGLGAGHGVATATAFGVLVLIASLPGAIVLIAASVRRAPNTAAPAAERDLVGARRG